MGSQDSLMLQDQENLDQRESAALDKLSLSERRMTQLNMLLEERSRLARRPDTSHQTSNKDGRQAKKTLKLTKRFSLSTSRKRRLLLRRRLLPLLLKPKNDHLTHSQFEFTQMAHTILEYTQSINLIESNDL